MIYQAAPRAPGGGVSAIPRRLYGVSGGWLISITAAAIRE